MFVSNLLYSRNCYFYNDKNQIIDFKSDVPPFEYEDSDLVQETMTLFEQYRDKGDEYLNYYAENGSSFEKSMAENLLQLQENITLESYRIFQCI